MAAGVATVASAAQAYYEKTCGYGPDPRPGIAENSDGTYEMNPETYAPKTARTLAVGANDAAAGWYGQGGLIGHLGRVPMVNAFGVLHDTWATRFGWSAISLPSQGTWVPALVVAESALLADAAASAMVTGAIRENNPR